MSNGAPAIRSRPPSGRVPWPLVLIEGDEKSGKSFSAALFSRSERISQTYWIDLGEGSADEYGAIPGVRYQVVEHDGTYAAILDQIRAVKAEARRATDAGEAPVTLVVDTVSDVWEGLKNWASERARQRKANREKRTADPNAEIQVSMDLWNDAGTRYRRLMTELLTFPGIVVAIARGKPVAALDESGRPIERQKDYRVEGHKTLPYDATLWLRMSRTGPPIVVGCRSVHAGIRPGKDDPQPITADAAVGDKGNLLEWLVFTVLRCAPESAEVRDVRNMTGGELNEDEKAADPDAQPATVPPATDTKWLQGWLAQVKEAATTEALAALRADANAHRGQMAPKDAAVARASLTEREAALNGSPA